jgi:hypothetical protein
MMLWKIRADYVGYLNKLDTCDSVAVKSKDFSPYHCNVQTGSRANPVFSLPDTRGQSVTMQY